MNNITFCGIFYNEEKRLKLLLPKVKKYCSKLVCVVQNSTDKTLEICKTYCNKVIERPMAGYSECDRGILINAVDTEWVLYLDGDENPTDKFLNSLEELIKKNDVYGMLTIHGAGNVIDSQEVRYRLFKKTACYSLLSYHSDWRPYKNKSVENIPYPCIEHFKSEEEYINDVNIASLFRYEIPYNPTFVNEHAKEIAFNRYSKSSGYEKNTNVAHYLTDKFKNLSVYDFNCGDGFYTHKIVTAASACNGFSSNKIIPIISRGVCSELDISQTTVNLGFKRDWSICIAEKGFINQTTIENIILNTTHGMIFRCKNDYIKYIINTCNKNNFTESEKDSNNLSALHSSDSYRYLALERNNV